MKRNLLLILSTIVLATAGSIAQASTHQKAHTQTQQCVGPAGFCTPYFGS